MYNPSDVSRESLASENGTNLDTPSSQNSQTMYKNNKKVFIDNIRIETQTVYNENGSINIFPCAFEENHFIVADGDRASQKGRMETHNDGTSHFRPYAVGSGSRYNMLHISSYGEVKETSKHIIFVLRFPKHLGLKLIKSLLRMEQEEQWSFFKSLRFKKSRKRLLEKKSSK